MKTFTLQHICTHKKDEGLGDLEIEQASLAPTGFTIIATQNNREQSSLYTEVSVAIKNTTCDTHITQQVSDFALAQQEYH